jgi:tetratricopeptide (TPR) repeat protein
LPLTDRDSRIVIARATTRLGYARTVLSMARPTADGRLDPDLLSEAAADYRRSTSLLQGLLDASPDDARVCRYLADALGVFGMGCCFRFAERDGEAESAYRRSIELRRALVRGCTPGGMPVGPDADLAGEVDNFSRLLSTVELLAGMYQDNGRRPESEALERELEGDIVALAARTSGPEFRGLRSLLTKELLKDQSPATQAGRQRMVRNCRWMLLLEPENPYANNNLAWAMTSAPEDSWYDPAKALELARKAVQLHPASGDFWNTLGVAAFRLKEWKIADDALRKSIRSSGGAGVDCFFLAMACWHQGNRDDARQWFDRAVAWIERTRSEDAELRRFHGEAAALLGPSGPGPRP